METFDKICKFLDPYKYVSFDVFDTLIFRTVASPNDIFRLISNIYESKYEISCRDFVVKRSYAETNARNCYRRDICIDEIYKFIDYSPEKSKILKEIEKECEIQNCIENQIMVDVLHWCQSKNKIILITSDMYLTKDVFDRILQKIGVTYDYIYISGEVGVTKRSGLLFNHILKTLQIKEKDIAHIGDDPHNDIAMPQKYGIASTLRIQRSGRQEYYMSKRETGIVNNHLYHLFCNVSKNIEADAAEFRIGYTVLGPFLYTFCRWVHQVKKNKGLDYLYFLSRDGYLIKKVYDLIYPEDVDFTKYIYLNKNLLRMPSLDGENKVEKFILSLPPRREYKWDELVAHLFVESKSDLFDELKKKSISFDSSQIILLDDLKKGKYDIILGILLNYCYSKIKEQTILLEEYLDSFCFYNSRIGLVNNSMQGSVQKLLYAFAKEKRKKIEVHGVQFTASESCLKDLDGRVSVFWGNGNDFQSTASFFRGNCLIFEHFLFEPCGTALNFYRINSKGVGVNLKNAPIESMDRDVIDRIQKYVLLFARDYNSHISLDLDHTSKKMMNKLLSNPYKKDASLIGNLWDEDVEGNRQLCNFEKPLPRKNILFHHLSPDYGWDVGCFVQKGMPEWFLKIWHLRNLFVIYNKEKKYLCDDILYATKSIFLFVRRNTKQMTTKFVLFIIRIKLKIASCLNISKIIAERTCWFICFFCFLPY